MSKEEKDIVSIASETPSPPPVPEKKKFRWTVSDDHSPPEIYNWTLYLSVLVFGILGSARGLDEGTVSGSLAQVSFKKTFGLSDENKTEDQIANLKSNIASMVQLGSIGGSILAMYTVDKLGRIRALQLTCIIWVIAAAIQVSSKEVGQLYAGRLIEGLAIGQTTTIGPTYMSEVAPRAIRGLCGCVFAGAVYFGIMMGYFANYGTAIHLTGDKQWRIPTSLKIVFATAIFFGSTFLCVESPRWHMKVGNPDKAAESLGKLRGLPVDHPYVVGEISDINEQIETERREVAGNSIFSLFKEVLFVSSVRYRFFMCACMAQLLGQWSGANAITIYSPELMAMIGVTGTDKLKWTAILGVVKFVSAYLGAFFIIDFLGRRRALYIGITLQLLCILYFAIYLTLVPEAEVEDAVLTTSQIHAGKGALAALYLSGTGWTLGFNSVQYLIGSEIFPLKVRSFAQSWVMVFHFALQYSNSKALPKMMIAMNNSGAFFFFVGVLILALLWAWIFIPEVSGRSLESMEEIFSLPWYQIGRKGAQLCPDYSEVNKISYHKENAGQAGEIQYDDHHSKASAEHIERR
ncbi:high-affinity glucose transporter Hxt2p [[Candida] railenensis]|uniref:High-affinity glucose transporter Hxt2p n=1 Tax=[Candida] railenensis TaxID=45579 RepID=A0A9P0QTC3_9ASCO|nr:high-affinity glucose transporter Hxt2p [[Candida] railenensis]